MIRVILTRHGETIWNLQKRVQGSLDSPLTENGIRQAQRLAMRLRHENIKYLYSSDLSRAIATAEEIKRKLGLENEIILSPLLRELSFGDWEGQIWSELRENHPDIFAIWDREPHKVVIPGGESMEMVSNRAWDFFQEVINKHKDETVCMVTHGLTLKLLVTKALGFGVEDWEKTPWQYNTALNILEFDGNAFIPIVVGDSTHLED